MTKAERDALKQAINACESWASFDEEGREPESARAYYRKCKQAAITLRALLAEEAENGNETQK